MKKLLILVIALALALTLAACTENKEAERTLSPAEIAQSIDAEEQRQAALKAIEAAKAAVSYVTYNDYRFYIYEDYEIAMTEHDLYEKGVIRFEDIPYMGEFQSFSVMRTSSKELSEIKPRAFWYCVIPDCTADGEVQIYFMIDGNDTEKPTHTSESIEVNDLRFLSNIDKGLVKISDAYYLYRDGYLEAVRWYFDEYYISISTRAISKQNGAIENEFWSKLFDLATTAEAIAEFNASIFDR